MHYFRKLIPVLLILVLGPILSLAATQGIKKPGIKVETPTVGGSGVSDDPPPKSRKVVQAS